MATLHHNGSAILRFLQNAVEESLHPTPPAGTTGTITFDEAANSIAVANLNADWNSHAIVAGALRRNGVAVALAADTAAATARKQVAAQGTALLAALRAGTATNAQIQRALAFLLNQYIQG